MRQSNWLALSVAAILVILICTALWLVFVDRTEPPGATGSIAGAPSEGRPVTPETPGR
ncbi:hypothetical protein [Microvirga sp. M2]|uniref:hypothetical protein n=1 Tax=Microvirga sp. M2 TaxID=3073270 RepID=UPI0039C42003